MKDREYWKERYEILSENLLHKGEEYNESLKAQYERAINETEKNIEVYYSRFATNNGITPQEARRLLNSKERKKFQMTVDEYIDMGIKNGVSGQWIKELESASNIYHIDRLKALQIQMRQQVELLSAAKDRDMTKLFTQVYEEGYYKSLYEIQKGLGHGSAFSTLDTQKIEMALAKSYDGSGLSFSEKIWGDRKALAAYIDTEFPNMVIRGEKPTVLINKLAKKFNVSKGRALTLVMTECSGLSSAANLESFKEFGVTEYENVETLDTTTCEVCGSMDGTVFTIDKFAIGETAAPFHPNCRGTQVPYFNDEFTVGEERAARNPDTGKTYYVPADMKFPEWEKRSREFAAFKSARDEFEKTLNLRSVDSVHIKNMINYSKTTDYKQMDSMKAPFAYLPKRDIIGYNPHAKDFDMYDMNYVQAHELSHRMDFIEYHSWENEDFLNAIEKSRLILDNNKEKILRLVAENGKFSENMALADIVSALSRGDFNDYLIVGHSPQYWSTERNAPLEIFANISAMDVLGDEALPEVESLFGELFNAYRGIIK